MKDRKWIGVVPGRYEKTVLVRASSFKEAQSKLNNPDHHGSEDVEGLDVSYRPFKGKIIREEK